MAAELFAPNYTITPTLLANVKRIATLTSELNRIALPGVVLTELEQRAVSLSAHTSTRIEGNPLPLTEVKRLLKSRPEVLRDSEREVVNYNEALLALNRLVSEGSQDLSLQQVLDIHRAVMTELLEPHFCGRLRAEPVVVNDPRTGGLAYLPPDQADVAPLMEGLIQFISRNRGVLDPLILAGLFHKQFVIIHPFTDGNGRTARLATKLLLAEMGINTFPLLSFENFYNNDITRYFARVGVAGNYYEIRKTIDFTEWLEYFTGGLIDELLRLAGELEVAAASPQTTPQRHHLAIMDHIREHGFITDRDYASLTNRAKATRALDFRKLRDWGWIERHGKGRATHYKLKS